MDGQQHEQMGPPTVVPVPACAGMSGLHALVSEAQLVLASDEDMNSGVLAQDYNVGLYLQAVWKAVPGVGVGGRGWGRWAVW